MNNYYVFSRSKYYAQFGNDKLIEKYFEDDYIGGCIDIGANNGIYLSNTKYFEDKGWYCLCIEPNKSYYNDLLKYRKNSLDYITILNSIIENNYKYNKIDFISINSENTLNILKDFDINKYFPKLFIIELNDPDISTYLEKIDYIKHNKNIYVKKNYITQLYKL